MTSSTAPYLPGRHLLQAVLVQGRAALTSGHHGQSLLGGVPCHEFPHVKALTPFSDSQCSLASTPVPLAVGLPQVLPFS